MDGAVKHDSREQWLAFGATMSGWILDAFDYNILAIILLDIQKSFTVDSALAGALATVTLVMRLIGIGERGDEHLLGEYTFNHSLPAE